MKVLSLFDGMSCGQIALNRCGIKYDTYYASEIDKHAIKVTQRNYPDTIQLGDVTKLDVSTLPKIDLLIGGSPCQGFSFAGKGLNFEDPRSKLFFEYVRILNEVRKVNPDVKFLLENVRMKKEHEIVISKYMGTNPLLFNSSYWSAQNRERLYWTNINEKAYGLFGDKFADIPQPKDKGLLLRDILESEVDEKYYLSDKMLSWLKKHSEKRGSEFKRLDGNQKASTITTTEAKQNLSNDFIRQVKQLSSSTESGGKQPYQQNRIYDTDGLCPALCASDSNAGIANIREIKQINENQGRQGERVYGVDGISPCLLSNNTGGAEPPKIVVHSTSPRSGDPTKGGTGHLSRSDGKTYCLQTTDVNRVEYNERIRRLTPTECERLQTVPDGYTEGVSDTQRYRMLGNGWTIDVIVHILGYLPREFFENYKAA